VQQCNSLDEVRTKIDSIDEQIVTLLAERTHYIKQAASFKQSVEAVKAPERVESVIEHVRSQAVQQGISANLLEELYRVMIDKMVDIEIAEFTDAGHF